MFKEFLKRLHRAAEDSYNKEVTNLTGNALTRVCYAEGYLDAVKEIIAEYEKYEKDAS